MKKIKSLLGELTNSSLDQDIGLLKAELQKAVRDLKDNQLAIEDLKDQNESIKRELILACERLDDTASNVTTFIEKAEDTKAAYIAISSWAIFFVAVASAVYVIANNL